MFGVGLATVHRTLNRMTPLVAGLLEHPAAPWPTRPRVTASSSATAHTAPHPRSSPAGPRARRSPNGGPGWNTPSPASRTSRYYASTTGAGSTSTTPPAPSPSSTT
ncbi:hypothetical protein [Streptomyces sp. NBS 14/10]|uniref:hypothetical protein n=1 Tax=Streptomyces sp. NBS 14/10 TaxID=1945643 RepID=UPI0015C5CCB1|nr:hypothetical protein [Streptomyces sp.]